MRYIPYDKLSKQKRREEDKRKREGWGLVNPVTRKIDSEKNYNRKKDRRWRNDADGGVFLL